MPSRSGGFGKSASHHASKGVVSAITRNAAIRYAADNMSEEILFRTPMGRWGDASEVASVISFLAGPESSYITGVELFVDGGWMAV